MKPRNVKLNRADLFQMKHYLTDRDEGRYAGWYYGNKDQFEKRHEKIRSWILNEIDKIEQKEY